jgi:acetyl-CoA carboxylase carboxyl transferase subunit alpha
MRLGVVDEVVSEPQGGAHRDHEKASELLKTAVLKNLERFAALTRDELLLKRYEKFRRLGNFAEV